MFRQEKRSLWGNLIAAFQYLKRVCKKDGDRHLVEPVVIGQGVNLRKAFFMMSIVNHGHRLPREVVDGLFLETSKVRLNGTLSHVISLKMSLLIAG